VTLVAIVGAVAAALATFQYQKRPMTGETISVEQTGRGEREDVMY
jgi:hypothetical protein